MAESGASKGAGAGGKRAFLPLAILCGAVALHVLMMASLFTGYLDGLFADSNKFPQAYDFFSIYEAGNNVLDGRSAYSFYTGDAAETPYHAPYRYVPVFAYVLSAPLNAAPHWQAYWGWVAFYELLLVINAYLTWRIAEGRLWGAVAASMWLVFSPMYLELYMGQFSFLMATALFWTGIGLARGREGIAALPWFVSLIAKANSAVLAFAFARLRWWRTLALGGAALALNVPYFLWRRDDFGYFAWTNFHDAVRNGGFGLFDFDASARPDLLVVDESARLWNFSPGEQSLAALVRNVYLAIDKNAADAPGLPFLALAVAIVTLSIVATFAVKADALNLFVIWISTPFLLYPTWEHHYVMYLPVLVLLVALRPQARPIALIAFVLIALPTPYWLMNNVWNTGPVPGSGALLSEQEAWPAWGVALQHAVKPLAVLAVWAYCVWGQLRGGGEASPIRDVRRQSM